MLSGGRGRRFKSSHSDQHSLVKSVSLGRTVGDTGRPGTLAGSPTEAPSTVPFPLPFPTRPPSRARARARSAPAIQPLAGIAVCRTPSPDPGNAGIAKPSADLRVPRPAHASPGPGSLPPARGPCGPISPEGGPTQRQIPIFQRKINHLGEVRSSGYAARSYVFQWLRRDRARDLAAYAPEKTRPKVPLTTKKVRHDRLKPKMAPVCPTGRRASPPAHSGNSDPPRLLAKRHQRAAVQAEMVWAATFSSLRTHSSGI